MSPMNREHLPYFGHCVKKEIIEDNTEILLIPLGDGIIDTLGKRGFHVDSMCCDSHDNPTSRQICEILFNPIESAEYTFSSLFDQRMQLDSNSCGRWLLAGMVSYCWDLPLPTSRKVLTTSYMDIYRRGRKTEYSTLSCCRPFS